MVVNGSVDTGAKCAAGADKGMPGFEMPRCPRTRSCGGTQEAIDGRRAGALFVAARELLALAAAAYPGMLLAGLCVGYPQNQNLIPNGHVNGQATGHAGGVKAFRVAFLAAGLQWTWALCQADQDGD
eukprot:580145-Prymnesium_polylepis.1